MSFDDRLRDELRQAADTHDLREEAALQHVKMTQPTQWADLTVVALQDPDSPRASHVRAQRLVGALAACALLAGAFALPLALRSRSRAAAPPFAGSVARSSTCGPPVTTGYRSTAVLRIAEQPSTVPGSTNPPSIELAEPVQFALGLCDSARAQSHLPSDDPSIGFDATTNASGDLLSLTVITRARNGTTALARNWAAMFREARLAEAKRQIRAQQVQLIRQVEELHKDLQRVDKQLAKLAPRTYGNVEKFDSPDGGLLGISGQGPPPVPEQGSTGLTNLAFERIQILSKLSESGARAARLRITAVKPDVFATVVSQTPAVLIKPPHNSNTSTVLMAVGLLLGGAALAGSAFLLGRRTRRPQPS